MEIKVTRIISNNDSPDFSFSEARVSFWDDVKSPHFGAEVTVFMPKSEKSLKEIEKDAVAKAREFLTMAAKS